MRRGRVCSAESFIQELAQLEFDDVFNPYSESCPDIDVRGGAAIRRQNLRLVLKAAIENGVDSLWIARDLGYRGGRRTGLALTDEVHLDEHATLFGNLPLKRATKGEAVSERTATTIWHVLKQINRPIFLWNVFPLHPHERGDPMSNRSHTRAERLECFPFLLWLVQVLQPRGIVAIGRDAQLALEDLGISARQVRHPSYGGQNEFIATAQSMYGLAKIGVDSTIARNA
jgi:hypothetical protein